MVRIQIASLLLRDKRDKSEHVFHNNETNHEEFIDCRSRGQTCSGLKRSRRRNKVLRNSCMVVHIISFALFLLSLLNGSGVSANEIVLARAANATNKTQSNNSGSSEVMVGNETVDETQLEIPDTFVTTTRMPTPKSPKPSAPPSIEPSMAPSTIPSSSPSIFPSMYPTLSAVPSNQPSALPTSLPSASPSDVPSALPTLTCHDMASYRSPINDLTCDDHANTDCMRWRYLGLNLTGLQELAESCPVTCDIDCGYFTPLDTNISFIISNVPNLIDDLLSRPPLENMMLQYLTEYTLKNSPITNFALTSVELLSQEPLNSTMSPRINNTSRNLAAPVLRRTVENTENTTVATQDSINLQVKMNLQGFRIYSILIVLTDLFLAGIDSPEFTAELRKSNIFYANATASSAAQAKPSQADVSAPPERSKLSTAAIVIVLVVIACVAVFGIFFYRKHSHILRSMSKKRELPMNTGEMPQNPTGSGQPNAFSFDLSPQSSTGFGRLLAVFGSENTVSRDSTSTSSSSETAPSPQKPKSIVEEHPLTGIIPPMLVIGNIDKPDSNASMRAIPETQRSRRKIVVPSRRMDASKSFIEALNNHGSDRAGSASSFADLMYNVSSLGSGPRADGTELSRSLAAVLSGDASIPDDSSVSSTPIKRTDMNVKVPKRRTLSSAQQLADDVDVREVIENFIQKYWEQGGAPRADYSASMHELNVSVSYDKPPLKSPQTESHHRRSSSWDKRNLIGSPKSSFRKVAETKKIPDRASKKHLTRNASQTSRASRNSNSSPTHRRNRSKTSSRGSNSFGDVYSADGECLYVYEASHRGYLGIAIEPCQRGTRIQSVKEYSPLFGLLDAGDRIVDVDGIDTTHYQTPRVAELLRRTKGRSRKISITVARTTNDAASDIAALPIKVSKRRSKSIDTMPVHVRVAPVQTQFRELSSVTDLDSSYTDIPSPPGELEEEEDVPFHFIGASAYDDPDFESFSDISAVN